VYVKPVSLNWPEFFPRVESMISGWHHLTLSLLGYLKTRIRWGGGQFDPPPSKSHVLCPNMTNDTSLESSCALLLESKKKFANLQKLNFLSQNPVI